MRDLRIDRASCYIILSSGQVRSEQRFCLVSIKLKGVPMGTITYFAYGSNTSLKRLQKRVPSAEPKGRAVLRCHRLAFHKVSRKDGSGKCDIPPASGSDVVWGRLYHIDDEEKECLDRYEGLGYGYDDKCVTVELDSGCTVCAITYYATEKDSTLKPYTWYIKHILVGAKEACLPSDYIKQIEEVEAEKDPCKKREWEELKIYRE